MVYTLRNRLIDPEFIGSAIREWLYTYRTPLAFYPTIDLYYTLRELSDFFRQSWQRATRGNERVNGMKRPLTDHEITIIVKKKLAQLLLLK